MWTADAERLRALIARRRSVVGYNTNVPIRHEAFCRILQAALPGKEPLRTLMPFTRPLVPLMLLCVHRVVGLPPGLYALVRDRDRHDWIREVCLGRPYLWVPVEGFPSDVPLFLLAREDLQEVMQTAALGQPIAAESAAVAMFFAEYEPALRRHGAWLYRRMIWEACATGHALWLAAEAEGLRGAAIGAFFGPYTHEVFGVDKCAVRDLYHFSFGVPRQDSPYGDDSRFLPPYAHLSQLRARGGRDRVDTRESRIAQITVNGEDGQRTGMPWDYEF